MLTNDYWDDILNNPYYEAYYRDRSKPVLDHKVSTSKIKHPKDNSKEVVKVYSSELNDNGIFPRAHIGTI